MVDKNIKITREKILSSSYETDENLFSRLRLCKNMSSYRLVE